MVEKANTVALMPAKVDIDEAGFRQQLRRVAMSLAFDAEGIYGVSDAYDPYFTVLVDGVAYRRSSIVALSVMLDGWNGAALVQYDYTNRLGYRLLVVDLKSNDFLPRQQVTVNEIDDYSDIFGSLWAPRM